MTPIQKVKGSLVSPNDIFPDSLLRFFRFCMQPPSSTLNSSSFHVRKVLHVPHDFLLQLIINESKTYSTCSFNG